MDRKSCTSRAQGCATLLGKSRAYCHAALLEKKCSFSAQFLRLRYLEGIYAKADLNAILLVKKPTTTAAWACSVKRCSQKFRQNSQENTNLCQNLFFLIKLQVFSCEFYEISKNTFSYRKPPVSTSGHRHIYFEKCLKIFGEALP